MVEAGAIKVLDQMVFDESQESAGMTARALLSQLREINVCGRFSWLGL